jgi:tetratricopeptide (TPR) repeat protein
MVAIITLAIETEPLSMLQRRTGMPLPSRPRYWRVWRALMPALLALGLMSATAVAEQAAIDACANVFDPSEVVTGCSAVIGSDWATDEQLRLAFNNRANARATFGEIEAAIDDYGRALGYDPHYVNARYNRATLYLDIQQYDAAIADFDVVLKLKPDWTDALNNRALALLSSNQLDAAIESFTSVIALDPAYAYAYNNRGVAWRRKNEPARALEDFSRAIQLRPNYVGALNSRGELLALAGRSAEAVADFCSALALAPEHPAASANLRTLLGDPSLHW